MSIAHASVRRPVTTIMVFTAIVLLGLISWSRLPQELFPSISYPQITVATNYKNASPEEIESLVTKLVEEAVGTVNRVKRIKSISREGLSLVIIDFNWGTNMDFAALAVREKIDLIKERLPRDCEDPVVMKYNPFELPIMNLAITSDTTAPLELREITRKYIKESVEKIEGVANATITGGDIKEILVEIDQARLNASQISIVSIVDALKNANLNYPAGTIKESVYEYLIRTMGEFQTLQEIRDTPAALEIPEEEEEIKKKLMRGEKIEKERRLVYLRDIATVTETVKEQTSIARYNGKNNISLVIRKQSGVNTLKVAESIRKELKKLKEQKLPRDVAITISYDQSTFITDSITNLRDSAIMGGILALIILYIFLRHILSALTIALSIPISLMATFCLMYFAKINLNMMSLGGLALGVGMLVDNSIVVIENIFRHRNMNKPVSQACAEGATEVFPPILGSTMTTVAVFLPFAFVVGIAGQIFKQLSFTITFSLVISIIVAISLIPVIISLGKGGREKTDSSSSFAPGVRHRFSSFLTGMMHARWLIILVVLGLFAGSAKLLTMQEKRFLPEFDQRQFIVKVDLAPGTRLELTDSAVKKIEDRLLAMPDIKDITVNIGSSEEKTGDEAQMIQTLGSHQAQIMVRLEKKSKKKGYLRSTKDLISSLKESLEKDRELDKAQITYVAQETSLGQAVEQSAPVAIEISGPNLATLAEIGSQLKSELKGTEGLYSVKSSLIPPTPETKLNVLKDKASLYGLSVQDIAITAQVAVKGYIATQYKLKGEEKDIDIRVRLRPEDRASLENLRRLLIRSPLSTMVPLSQVAYTLKGTGPTEIQRINQQRTLQVTANLLNRPLNEVLADVKDAVAKVEKRFPDTRDYTLAIAGEQQQMEESFDSLAFALVFAIILVYMIMASEFESLWQPFIIMFTVPLSLIGVTAILILTKTPLSVVAYLGIIMLGGIVVNNGIVLVDFINNLRQQGYSIREAAVEGASVRLRPILMTSLTTILGMVPLAMGIGEGSELRAPLARTVIGGLFSSAFLTLVFIPAVYIVFNELLEQVRGKPLPVKAVLPEEEEREYEPYPEEKEKAEEDIYLTEEAPSEEQAPAEEGPYPEGKEQPEKEKQPLSETQKYFAQKTGGIFEETVQPEAEEVHEPQPEIKGEEAQPEAEERPQPEAKEEKQQTEAEEEKKPEMPARPSWAERIREQPQSRPYWQAAAKTPPPEEKQSQETQLNERQQELLELLKTREKITRTEYAKLYSISIPTAARDLKFLSAKGFIVGKGPLGPGRWYELKNKG